MLALMRRLLRVPMLVTAAGAPAGAPAAADPLAGRGGRLVDAQRQRRLQAGALHTGLHARRRRAFVPTPFPYAYLQPAVGRSFTSFWSNREGIRSEFVRVLRHTPLTVRGSGSASITVTRR